MYTELKDSEIFVVILKFLCALGIWNSAVNGKITTSTEASMALVRQHISS